MTTVAEQAAEWLLRLEEDAQDPAVNAEFQEWLALDPAHAKAVQLMQGMIASLEGFRPQSGVAHQAIQAGIQQDKRRKQFKRGASLLALLFVLALPARLMLEAYPLSYWLSDIHTATAEWQSSVLPDQSQITLNGHTAVDVDFTTHRRVLTLLQGEILIDVAKDASRPFVVKTEHGSITALGTRFVVGRHRHSTEVLMLESKVNIKPEAPSDRQAVVKQGEGVNVTSQGVEGLHAIDPDSINDAWKLHQLVVQSQPLSDVLATLARHHKGYLRYDEAALSQYQVSAVLPLDEPERALALLAESFPIKVQQFTPWMVSVNLKP
ncbi:MULTISPECIES: FecR domain-containing protein [unclassified Methylophilus]|uniref:FecR family protein n=1 Tax=unclassified Methylophilus TaxID=2630143 RepID=UPI00036BC697|nr:MULTISPECIES: FecR domain-containing protein [unclassified Methylophilus]